MVASDFDDDGYPDLYVACDSTPSLLYMNQRDGTFEENGLLAGVALNDDGQEQGGMGVAVADYDEDGHIDIVKTNFSDDVPNLYRNNGDGTFEDRVFQSGLGGYMQYVGWGVHLLDVDHDGRRDLLMVNGHVYPEAEQLPGAAATAQPRLLYWNVGGGRFKDISDRRRARHPRGVVVARFGGRRSRQRRLARGGRQQHGRAAEPAQEHRARARTGCSCVRSARARTATRSARASRVFVGDRRLSGEVQGGASFLSQNDPRLHFGLGGDAATSASRCGGRRARWSGIRAVRRIESSW